MEAMGRPPSTTRTFKSTWTRSDLKVVPLIWRMFQEENRYRPARAICWSRMENP
nr:hypothetical protein [uncultured bacterium]